MLWLMQLCHRTSRLDSVRGALESDWRKLFIRVNVTNSHLFSYQNLIRDVVKQNEAIWLSKKVVDGVLTDLQLERCFQLNLSDKMLARVCTMVSSFYVIFLLINVPSIFRFESSLRTVVVLLRMRSATVLRCRRQCKG